MYRLFFTPEWFNGLDILFDVVSVVIALLIAAYSWRLFQVNRENKYVYFSLAFIFVAFGLSLKAFTNGVLYFFPMREVVKDVLYPLAGEELSLSHLYYRASFFLQMLSMLGAWLLIFFISQKPRERLKKFYEVSQIGLFIYLVFLISFVSNFKYFVFYLTSTVLLSLIVLNYYKKYLNSNNRNTYKVMWAFLFILFGNIFFIFVFFVQGFYVIGEILMLLGFLQLLHAYTAIKRR